MYFFFKTTHTTQFSEKSVNKQKGFEILAHSFNDKNFLIALF